MKLATPIAVTSRSFSKHPTLRAELLSRYERVTFNDEGSVLAGDKLVAFLRGHVKAITALEVLNESVFERLPELRTVSKYGVGLDTLDLAAMQRYGIRLGWTPGVNRRSVAEITIAFAIFLLHRMHEGGSTLRTGSWRQPVGRQLSGRTIGIIGCGHVGKDVAVLSRAFDCRVLACDILEFPQFYARHQITPVELDLLLRESDVVTLHVPLRRSTEMILNQKRLAMMKKGAVLINTARGKLVDELALKINLKNGHIAAAAFDVFTTEPPDDLELLSLTNFLATPHIGGSTEEAILDMGRAAILGLEEAIEVTSPMLESSAYQELDR